MRKRDLPVVCSMNNIGIELIPQVEIALREVGFIIYSASCVDKFGSYLKGDKFADEIEYCMNAAAHKLELDPAANVVVVIHYGDPCDTFFNQRIRGLIGDEPFVNYVDADTNSVSINVFRDDMMECLYQEYDMPPERIVGYRHSLCLNDGFRTRVVPVALKDGARPNLDAILSVNEYWYEMKRKNRKENEPDKAGYLRVDARNHGFGTMLYEVTYKEDGLSQCRLVSKGESESYLEEYTFATDSKGEKRVYECRAILGTDVFLMESAHGKHEYYLMSLSSTEEEMNKFLNSELLEELLVVKND